MYLMLHLVIFLFCSTVIKVKKSIIDDKLASDTKGSLKNATGKIEKTENYIHSSSGYFSIHSNGSILAADYKNFSKLVEEFELNAFRNVSPTSCRRYPPELSKLASYC